MTHIGGSATREVANVKAGNFVLGDRHSIVSSARIRGRLAVDYQLELRRPHDRQLGRRGAFENAPA
jgi:hypothetical protein